MRNLLSLMLLAASITSCQHIYYAPNTANAPLLSEKSETKIHALYAGGMDSEYNGGELQFAHAISKNVGVLVNGFSAAKTETISDFYNGNTHKEDGRGSYGEFAVGLFKPFDENKKWIGELYAGTGLGTIKSTYGWNDRSEVGFTKYFLQPSIGFKGRYFEFAIVPKVSLVNWKVKQASIAHADNQDHRDIMELIRSDKSFVAFEPAFIIRAGSDAIKVQVGLSFSNYKVSNFASQDLAESTNACIGLSIDIKPKKK
ncbi:MAG: hypothetical protein ACXWV0_07640 [Flavisolibacter sp.]